MTDFNDDQIISITNIRYDDQSIKVCNIILASGKKLNDIMYDTIKPNHLIIK